MVDSFEAAAAVLPAAAWRSLELAHRALLAGGLAVGSVITDASSAIVAEGRNRCYDPPTGTDPLEGTPLAHAEMNALALLRTDVALAGTTIWSTQRPCRMCRAAIDFVGIARIRAIAADPSDPTQRVEEELDHPWIVLATVMFLVGALRRGGPTHPIVLDNTTTEPEAVDLALRVVGPGVHPLTNGSPFTDAVGATWGDLLASGRDRRRRTGDGPPARGAT